MKFIALAIWLLIALFAIVAADDEQVRDLMPSMDMEDDGEMHNLNAKVDEQNPMEDMEAANDDVAANMDDEEEPEEDLAADAKICRLKKYRRCRRVKKCYKLRRPKCRKVCFRGCHYECKRFSCSKYKTCSTIRRRICRHTRRTCRYQKFRRCRRHRRCFKSKHISCHKKCWGRGWMRRCGIRCGRIHCKHYRRCYTYRRRRCRYH